MNRQINQQNWLYLLTALVLLMQSFAIWHDSSHSFHIADEQCQRFESVSHTPTIEIVNTLPSEFSVPFSGVNVSLTPSHIINQQWTQHAIRAPPVFS
ncbi:MAG: hypothetical protein GQ475_00640 [Methylococcaceae bacterium]|nr:hypothetical protein [Methylococcaceae bacterium]